MYGPAFPSAGGAPPSRPHSGGAAEAGPPFPSLPCVPQPGLKRKKQEDGEQPSRDTRLSTDPLHHISPFHVSCATT